MCGLCGVYGWIGPQEKKVFQHLQLFSQLRGRDSTGVAIIKRGKSDKDKVVIHKEVGGVESLIDKNPAHFNSRDWTLNANGALCLMGHSRHATVGLVNEEAAHPFEYDNIVGCHNGTVLKYNLTGLPTYDVNSIDSQIILEAINNNDKPKDVISKLTGAWALTWFEKQDDTLVMVRNGERTLYTAKDDSGMTLYYASESWMLHVALNRNNVKWDGKVRSLNEDKLVVWGYEKNKISILHQEKAEGKYVAPFRQNYQEYTHPAPIKPTDPITPSRSVVSLAEAKKNLSNIISPQKEQFVANYAFGFDNSFLPRRKFDKLIEGGCQCCQAKLTWEDRDIIYWFDDTTPVCGPCYDKDFKQDDAKETARMH